jgi:molybdopterin molybdotransferase
MNPPRTLRDASCADDYDPNSMPVDKARALIRASVRPVEGSEHLHIRSALGRVFAQDVVSPLDVPGHDNSAMDGWAVRFADLAPGAATTLARIGESFAGRPYEGALRPGTAVRIFTGAVMPAGADTVVMQERATDRGASVTIAPGAVTSAGQNRRVAGEDLKRGEVVFRAGQLVRAPELGVLASLGINEVAVYRKLRVAFFSTGDELRPIGSTLATGEIYDSNRYTLLGMLARLD